MQPRIVFVAGLIDDRVIPLVRTEVSFGRDPSNTVHLNDDSVSRYHCCIRNVQGLFRIFDLQSLNGTFINDVAVPERTLKHGDKIRIGKSELLFLTHEDQADSSAVYEYKPARPNDPSSSKGAPSMTVRISFRFTGLD